MTDAPARTGDDAPAAPAHALNGKASGTVDPSLFLSVIDFKDPEGFLRNHDPILIAKWAFYYQCLNPTQRKAIGNWAGVVNKAVRANQPPRFDGHQNAAFYQVWLNSQN